MGSGEFPEGFETLMEPRLPNPLQKFIHRILMMRLVSAFLAVSLHHVDFLMLKISRGRHTITEIVGLPILLLTTLGARTGRSRTNPLVSLYDGNKIALIGSNFGSRRNPGWYYNLLANPRCIVRFNGRVAEYIARLAQGGEREKYWQLALAYYRGYERYKSRAAPHRVIPVMVLEPVAELGE
jgi:deazaflavin-dependent oxidoreductase (nitroreductase family)